MAARKGSGRGKGRQAVRNRSGGFPAWGWAVVGIAVGALAVALLMHRSLLPLAATGPKPNAEAVARHPSDAGAVPGSAESAPKKPKYDFYQLLSEKEVRIPDAEINARAQAEQRRLAAAQQTQMAAAKANPPASPVSTSAPVAASRNVVAAPAAAAAGPAGYLLQVGAFPDPADADSLKARLALQGFVANVQTVKVGGQTYHRVRLGPFQSATALEATKQRLAGAGISAIALKEGH